MFSPKVISAGMEAKLVAAAVALLLTL